MRSVPDPKTLLVVKINVRKKCNNERHLSKQNPKLHPFSLAQQTEVPIQSNLCTQKTFSCVYTNSMDHNSNCV